MEKKRYSLSLTPEHVQHFQSVCKAGGLPPSTMSAAVDDFLRDIAGVMEKATTAGKFSIGDFFGYLADQMKEVEEQNKKEVQEHVQQISATTKTKRSRN